MRNRTAVIGAGVAGLSSAVELLQAGHQVVLIEQTRSCGGRARSFCWSEAGCHVDTGPHLMMGCYQNFRWLLNAAGTTLPLQKRFTVELLGRHGEKIVFAGATKRPELALLRAQGLGILDKWGLIRGLMKASHLQNTTYVEEWLSALHQPPLARHAFWDPFVTAVLNQSPATGLSRQLITVLHHAFLDSDADPRLSISDRCLDELYVQPVVDLIRRLGCEVILGDGVVSLEDNAHGLIRAAITRHGHHIEAESYIIAVPPDALQQLLPASFIPCFRPSPIVSVHALLADAPFFPPGTFMGLLDSPFHWVFSRSVGNRCLLSLLTSHAQKLAGLSPDEITSAARDTLSTFFPGFHPHNILSIISIKERKATYQLTSPGQPFEIAGMPDNAFIAGDWIEPNYPCTIESAALSGRRAAMAVIKHGSDNH